MASFTWITPRTVNLGPLLLRIFKGTLQLQLGYSIDKLLLCLFTTINERCLMFSLQSSFSHYLPHPRFPQLLKRNTNEVYLESGDVLLYESSKCFHGRPKVFHGSYYANLFMWVSVYHLLLLLPCAIYKNAATFFTIESQRSQHFCLCCTYDRHYRRFSKRFSRSSWCFSCGSRWVRQYICLLIVILKVLLMVLLISLLRRLPTMLLTRLLICFSSSNVSWFQVPDKREAGHYAVHVNYSVY